MSTMVVQERLLWLNLAEMKDVDKARFLDAPISQAGLFGITVEGFAQQFSAVQKQTEAIQHILPQRDALSPRQARRPPCPSRAPSRPGNRRSGHDAGNPEMLEFALSQETARTAPLLPPEKGRAENPMFYFVSVLPLAWAKRARFGDAVPPHAPLASPLWDPGSSARMPQNALPSVPSSSTPLRCTTAGTPIVPLEPLAHRLEAWLALPSLSRWLTRTIRLGYAIQFARRPPKFNGILKTLVATRNAPVLREEIAVLLAKDAIEPVPPAEMRQEFTALTSSYPKKGGGLRPILDLRVLNRALHRLPFKMLMHRRMIKCIQPRDWFAAIDLKDAYFHV